MLSSKIAGKLLQRIRELDIPVKTSALAAVAIRTALTDRELEILKLVSEGHTNGRIARELWVTEQTVKFHLSNTYRKLGVANRTEASRYAHMNDLLAAA